MSTFWSFVLELQELRAHLNWSTIRILFHLLRAVSRLIFSPMATLVLFYRFLCWNFCGQIKFSCSFFRKDTLFWGWFRSQDFCNTLVPPFTFDWSCPLKQNLTKPYVRIKILGLKRGNCAIYCLTYLVYLLEGVPFLLCKFFDQFPLQINLDKQFLAL